MLWITITDCETRWARCAKANWKRPASRKRRHFCGATAATCWNWRKRTTIWGCSRDVFGKRDLIYVTTQLAIMVDTGITLSVALGSIMEQEQNPTLKKVLGELKAKVEGGDDFSSALAEHPKLFDKTFVSLIKASEATGKLGDMLNRLATYLRKEVDTRSKVRAAMAYPTVMLAVATAATIFLLTFVMPKFTPLFQSRGTSLPAPTQGHDDGLQCDDQLLVPLDCERVLLVGGFLYGKRTEPGRRVWDWLKFNTPIVGPMFRKVAITRSIRTLGTMIASGVPMLEALRLSSEVAGNYYYEKLWLDVLEQVTAGKQIHETITGNPLFPPVLVQMISSGEETGKLDDVLRPREQLLRSGSRNVVENGHQHDRAADDYRDGRGDRRHRHVAVAADLLAEQADVRKPSVVSLCNQSVCAQAAGPWIFPPANFPQFPQIS